MTSPLGWDTDSSRPSERDGRPPLTGYRFRRPPLSYLTDREGRLIGAEAGIRMSWSRSAYRANAEDPQTDQMAQQYQQLLAAPPEWHDGERVNDPCGSPGLDLGAANLVALMCPSHLGRWLADGVARGHRAQVQRPIRTVGVASILRREVVWFSHDGLTRPPIKLDNDDEIPQLGLRPQRQTVAPGLASIVTRSCAGADLQLPPS